MNPDFLIAPMLNQAFESNQGSGSGSEISEITRRFYVLPLIDADTCRPLILISIQRLGC